jgi:hypothetical protein
MSDLDYLRDDEGDPRADDIVQAFWPYDGPHSGWRISQAAFAASRLVRYMNNATQGQRGPGDAPAIGRIVGSVSSIVYGLDQLLDQLASAAAHLADDPTLYDDRNPSGQGGATARELAQVLEIARDRLRSSRGDIDRANILSGRLGHRSAGER